MTYVYLGVASAIAITMSLALTRSILGPSVYDRVLALNVFGTKTVLLIAVVGYLVGRPEWLDLALTYVLINFVGTLAVMRFSKYGSLVGPDVEDAFDASGEGENADAEGA